MSPFDLNGDHDQFQLVGAVILSFMLGSLKQCSKGGFLEGLRRIETNNTD